MEIEASRVTTLVLQDVGRNQYKQCSIDSRDELELGSRRRIDIFCSVPGGFSARDDTEARISIPAYRVVGIKKDGGLGSF